MSVIAAMVDGIFFAAIVPDMHIAFAGDASTKITIQIRITCIAVDPCTIGASLRRSVVTLFCTVRTAATSRPGTITGSAVGAILLVCPLIISADLHGSRAILTGIHTACCAICGTIQVVGNACNAVARISRLASEITDTIGACRISVFGRGAGRRVPVALYTGLLG